MEEFDLMRLLLLLLLLRNRGAAVFASDLDPQANCCIKSGLYSPKKTEKTNTEFGIKQSILVKWMILKYSLLGNIQDQNQTEF
jgi:hypothetical protein